MTREERKIRLACNNMDPEELMVCLAIHKIANDASLTIEQAIDVLKDQGIITFKDDE